MQDTWTSLPAGERTLVLEFGQSIDRTIVDQVVSLDARIHAAMRTGELPGVLETVPSFRSLALIFDPLSVEPDELISRLRALDVPSVGQTTEGKQHWQIPVHYGGPSGPDLSSVAELTGLPVEHVIELHQSTTVKVYMLGFLPGFAFMGDTSSKLHLPRRTEPRLRVPSGSVAIANQLTAVYPWDSPGGWHILGNCPIPLFDSRQDPPALFKTGDRVSFRAIGTDETQALKAAVDNHSFDRSSLLLSSPALQEGDGEALDP